MLVKVSGRGPQHFIYSGSPLKVNIITFLLLVWLTTDLVVALSVSSSQPSTTSMQTSASSGRTNTTTTMTDFSDDTNSYTSKTPISHDIGDFIELPLADSSSISSSDSSLG
jgi:hypothetical protein